MPRMPQWRPPQDVALALAEGDGSWEDERWAPLLVTALSGTEYRGRAIPVAWQIEFHPAEKEFKLANEKLEALGLEPDGPGWGEYIREAIRESAPALAGRLHLDDCEMDTCVVWVESQEDCRALLAATWQLLFAE